MADTFGLLQIPAVPVDVVSDPLGPPPADPALQKIGSFFQAVVNAYLTDAWNATTPDGDDPSADPVRTPPIKTVNTFNPEEYAFNDSDLPGLFIWRQSGATEWLAEDWTMDNTIILARWIMPGDKQEIARNRAPIANGLAKTIIHCLELDRDPSWVDPDDTDPEAATVPASANSFLLAKPTTTTPQSYSGAGLDGALGTTTLNPRLEPTIITSNAVGAYSLAAPIVITYLNWYGLELTDSFLLTHVNGGDVIGLGEDVAQVIQVDIAGQVLTTGSISIGNSIRNGRGSMILDATSATRIDLTGWKKSLLRIDQLDGDGRVLARGTYYGIDMTIDCREKRTQDDTAVGPSGTARAFTQTQVDFGIARSDGSIFEQGHKPDNS